MTRPLPETHYRLVPISELTEPVSGTFDVIVGNWWNVTEDGRVIFYRRGLRRWYGAPQCNPDRAVAEAVGRGLYPWPTELRQIPVVYVPHQCQA